MGRQVHHPAKTERRDATGLVLAGRANDGRYQYRSLSVMHHHNIVAMTHAERIGLAICLAIYRQIHKGARVFPMTRQTVHVGWGTYGAPEVWICRPYLRRVGQLFLDGKPCPRLESSNGLEILAHEIGHNTQDGGKPHGEEFKRAEVEARVRVKAIISKGWPKFRRMRDSIAPHLRAKAAKKKRLEMATSESRSARWTREVANAEKRLGDWQAKQRRAESGVAKWHKKLTHARKFLAKAEREEAT